MSCSRGCGVIFDSLSRKESAAHAGGLEAWLRERNPLWHLVGRVTFHLAENKRNEQQPFAFLATYTGETLRCWHAAAHPAWSRAANLRDKEGSTRARCPARACPCGNGAKQTRARPFGNAEDFPSRRMDSERGVSIHPEIPVLEESGLVVKVPDWWKGKRPSRPQVSITIDAGKMGSVGVNALLRFSADYTLDGETLTESGRRSRPRRPAS